MDNETRIEKLRLYLFDIIEELNKDLIQINANFLSNEIDNYSLDKIPTVSTVEQWVNGIRLCRDVFSFRSRNAYSEDVINNISNVGFYEKFENIINSNNEKGDLPEIDGIQSIQCLNCASIVDTTSNTAEFDIQIQIEYIN